MTTDNETNIALVDMDGTLCNYRDALLNKGRQVMDSILGRELTEEELWSNPYSNLRDLIKSQPNFWYNLDTIESGMKVLDIIKAQGFDIHILTKGPYRTTPAWTEKVNWCRELLPGTPVTITENKGMVYGKILFDDFPPYCEAWLKWRPRGLVLMPSYKYNEGFDVKYPQNVIRVNEHNLSGVEQAVKRVAERLPGEPL